MRSFCAMLLITAALISLAADDAPEWTEFASKEGHFKVLMPGKPEQKKLEAEMGDFGKGMLHMNTFESDKMMYGANYCDFPAKIKDFPRKRVYDSSRDGAVENLKGKLADEKDIKLGDHPGREILIDVAGGKRLFRARVYLVEQRLYQVVVFGSKEAATSKAADKFLDSFKLTEK